MLHCLWLITLNLACTLAKINDIYILSSNIKKKKETHVAMWRSNAIYLGFHGGINSNTHFYLQFNSDGPQSDRDEWFEIGLIVGPYARV